MKKVNDDATRNHAAIPSGWDVADVSFLILRAFYDLRGMLNRLLREHDLDIWVQPGMGPVLYALYEEDGCTIRDVAERIQLAPSTLTNTLQRMQKNGLVTLTKCAADRRAVRVQLTAQGQALEKKMVQLRTAVRDVLHGDMTSIEVEQAQQLLIKMIDAMEIHEWEAKHPRKKRSVR